MGRKKIKAQEEMVAHLQEFCALLSAMLNEVMRYPKFAGMIEIMDEDPSDDDASRTAAKQEIHLRG